MGSGTTEWSGRHGEPAAVASGAAPARTAPASSAGCHRRPSLRAATPRRQRMLGGWPARFHARDGGACRTCRGAL